MKPFISLFLVLIACLPGSLTAAGPETPPATGSFEIITRLEQTGLSVKVVSRHQKDRFCTISLRLKSFEGDILWHMEQAAEVLPDTAAEYVFVPKTIFPDQYDAKTTVLEVIMHAGGKVLADDLLYFAMPAELELPDPEYSYRCRKTALGFEVEFHALNILRDIRIDVEGTDAEVSHNHFDMAPGSNQIVMINAPGIASERDLLERLLVRHSPN